jgi:hypothetical protein
VSIDDLLAAVRRLAAAALLGRYWTEGGRHEAALALSGGLLQAGWEVDRVKQFVEGVCAAAQDPEASDRIRAVADSAEQVAAGGPVIGWPRLAEIVGEPVVTQVRSWLGVRAAGPRGAARPAAVREVEPYRPFPVAALPAPLAEYVRQVAAALGCDPAFIALGAAKRGRGRCCPGGDRAGQREAAPDTG